MNIAFIGQKSIPLVERGGGIENHVENLSVRLAERDHQVAAYVRPHFMEKRVPNYLGVKLIYIPSIATKNLDTITYTFLATFHALFKKYDIIHYHGIGPSTLSWIPRLFKPSAKVVVTFHSRDRFHKKWGWFARIYLGWAEWTACKFPHGTIAVSRSIRKYCFKKFKAKTKYIPNAVEVDPTARSDLIKPFGLEKNEYILTVARLVRHKGIHYLIDAFKKLDTKKKLVIAGAPSYTKDYNNFLNKLAGKDKRIIFTGYQTGETLKQLFCNAYLYAHPSESEGLSVTILEAMAYGNCVLVSDIPENLEALDHSGFVFKVKNSKDLQNRLKWLLSDPKLVEEMGQRAKDFIKYNFNWDKVVKETEKLYLNL